MKAKQILSSEEIINLLPEYIYWLDEHNTYHGGNLSYLNFLQLSSIEELRGKNNYHFKEILEETSIDAINKNNEQVIVTGKNQSFEEIFILKNGDKKIFLSHKFPLRNKEGKVCGLLVTSIDITHHKDHEDRLKYQIEQKELTVENIIAHMPGHVYWKDVEGVYLGCNNSQARSLGLRYGYEVIGKTDFDLSKTPEEALFFKENDMRIMESCIAETVEEVAQVNGKESIVLSRKTPLKDKNGKVIGILGVSIDITDRKKAEQELKLAKEAAEAANQAKTEFLHNMRHDLRTPFSGILGAADFLESIEIDPTKKETLGYITESAQELLNHLNEILEFVEMESGQFPILEKEFDIYALLDSVTKMMSTCAQKKQLDFFVAIEEGLPSHLIGDAIRTQRILMNLMTNAIKFTEKGSIKIHVKGIGKHESHGKILLRFVIEDTGMGIPEDKKDIIFERFNRLTSSYSGVYPGKGLGLRIVKQFLDEIDGQLQLESVVGKGTIFNILIPYRISLFSEANEKENNNPHLKYTVIKNMKGENKD